MSWITRITQQMIIRTGDGIEYEPQWMNASYDQRYNFNLFNYINVPGSQVNQEEPQSRRFNLEIHFIGDNHIDIGEQFRISAGDRRPWTIIHPYYDEITVHPVRLRFDHRRYNVTTITGLVVETIADRFPRETADRELVLQLQKDEVDELAALTFQDQTETITASEINDISGSIEQIETNSNTILDEANQIEFRNRVLNAQRDLTNVTTEPLQFLRTLQSTINFPSTVAVGVRARVDNLVETFERVVESLANVTGLSRNRKVYGESSGSTIISALITASTTNRDIQTRGEIEDLIDVIVNAYERYLTVLDGFETTTQTQLNSYAADPNTQNQLSQFMYFALSALIDISLDSQQEITVVNEADSNVIILTHRFYGLDDNDQNLDRFIETNNISLEELLLVPKDREVVYYV